MENEIRDVDSMKYRKSTHLASVDVDTIITEKGKCLVTIKDAYYCSFKTVNGKKIGVDVNGKQLEGYFIHFYEDIKPMMVNSGNRKNINGVVKTMKRLTSAESRNLLNWVDTKIELTFDPNVKFGSDVTGGIVVARLSPIAKINDTEALKTLKECKTLAELQTSYLALEKEVREYPTVFKLKETLKTTLS